MIIQNNDPYTQPSFSLKNRIMRLIWGVVFTTLFKTSPKFLHIWRACILRTFGAKIGSDVHVYPNVKIWAPWKLKLGNRIGIADGVIIYNMDDITIEDNCVISQGSHLCCGSHDVDSRNFQLITKPILIKKYSWICADAFIAPGVTVSEGSVIGARCVLTKSTSLNWGVWGGNPAKLLRMRSKNLQDILQK